MISDDDEDLKLIDLESTTWGKSLFKQVGFCKRAATTSRLEIPKLAEREAKFLWQYQVANLVEKYAIRHSMMMNFDQTPSKFAPVSSWTLGIGGTSQGISSPPGTNGKTQFCKEVTTTGNLASWFIRYFGTLEDFSHCLLDGNSK